MPPAEPTPADADARVRDLVAECIDRFEDEGPAAIDAICAAHPPLAAAIRAHVDQLERIGLLRRGGGDDRFPERLGEFRLLRRLGGGGMGVVYLAEQPSLARLVALKVVRPAELHFSRARERFRREAHLIATLRHPGIVPVFAFGEEGDVPYYAMEYVDGADLGEVLGRLAGRDPAKLTGADFETALREAVDERARAAAGASAAAGEAPPSVSFGGAARQPWVPFCLALARQAALALAHAHGAGVIHRDLKPSNLMLTRDGRVLLVDFGLSTGRKATRVTRSGSELGSLPYMAPEVLREGMEAVDARSDVYALGVTLYEMLALRSPFAGRDNEATRRNVLAGAPRRPSESNAAVPWDAETVCLAAMDLEPARRYATAADLARDLDHVLAMRPIEARPASAWLKTRRWAQRSPARAVATALALLVAIGGPLGYALVVQRAAQNLKLLNEELGKKQVALTSALGRESSERARAERHADRARRAVVGLLQDVAADDLRGVPQMVAVRKRLLEKALGFYQEMLADAPDDPAVRFERARTGRDVADLLKELGRFDEAEAIYVEQIAALRELAQERPDDYERQDALASCLGQLAFIQSSSGRVELAEKSWKEAIEILERFGGDAAAGRPVPFNLIPLLGSLAYAAYARGDVAESLRLHLRAATLSREILRRASGDPEHVSGFVNALDGAAACAAVLARPLEALAFHQEAWDAIQEATGRTPGDRRLRADLVLVANNYGLLLMSREDQGATERVLRRGYDEAVALQRDFPDDPDLRRRLAILAINLAVTLVNRDAQDDAVPILDRAVATLERLVAEVPERVEYPYLLGSALAASAGLRIELDEVDAAEAAAERAVKLLRAALAKSPGHVGMTAGLASALFEQGNVRRARGDLAGALQSAKEALALGSTRIDVLYEGVEVLGDCARDADSKGGEPSADVFVDLALAALRDAIRGGFTDVERLKSAPELELLRERSAFDELLRAIPARAPGR